MRGLVSMAGMTQRLQIRFVIRTALPKRYDMIEFGCDNDEALRVALHAQRTRVQQSFATRLQGASRDAYGRCLSAGCALEIGRTMNRRLPRHGLSQEVMFVGLANDSVVLRALCACGYKRLALSLSSTKAMRFTRRVAVSVCPITHTGKTFENFFRFLRY
jgi:hypothetical protein